MLFSLGRRIVYERETRTRKPTPKPDSLSQWRTMEVQRKYVTWMEIFKSKRDGVLPVESRRAGGVPGPVPQKGPPQASGGHPVPMRGARLRKRRVNATTAPPPPRPRPPPPQKKKKNRMQYCKPVCLQYKTTQMLCHQKHVKFR